MWSSARLPTTSAAPKLLIFCREVRWFEVVEAFLFTGERAESIARFESRNRNIRWVTPARDVRQRDLIPVFGASSVVSDVLAGKRGINKTHARRLAEFFPLPVT